KECLTKEMAAKEFEPDFNEPDLECDHELDVLSPTEANFTFMCKHPESDFQGQGRIWDLTAKAYKSQMEVAGQSDGHDIKLDIRHQARWVSDDCQGVEPETD